MNVIVCNIWSWVSYTLVKIYSLEFILIKVSFFACQECAVNVVKKFLERGQDVLPWINFFTSNALFVSSVVSSFCWIMLFHLPVNQLFLACQPSLVVCSYAAMIYCYVIALIISQVITYLVINVVTGLYGVTSLMVFIIHFYHYSFVAWFL